MKVLKKLPFFLAFFLLFSCDEMLNRDETVAGLKEALTVGSQYALKTLGAQDGFYLDMAVKIGLPQDAANLVNAASSIPMVKEIADQLVLAMNRAAEASIEEVIPVVAKAIVDMSIQEASTILFSSNEKAATDYLRAKTYTPLCGICQSVIEPVMRQNIVGTSALDLWKNLTGYYNIVASLPFVTLEPIETNLVLYATQKALDGVFVKVGDEEVKIRTDVNARVSDLLRRVFGQLD
jgi:hypothetical protein